MRILALDLGTSTGWCAGTAGSHISGTWNLKPGRFDSASMRLVRLLKGLDEIHAAMPLDAVFYEEVRRHKSTDAAHWFGAFWSHVIKWCDDNSIPHEGVPVGEIKKSFTGRGNADKAAMMQEAFDRGYCPGTDDEADAIALFLLKQGLNF